MIDAPSSNSALDVGDYAAACHNSGFAHIGRYYTTNPSASSPRLRPIDERTLLPICWLRSRWAM